MVIEPDHFKLNYCVKIKEETEVHQQSRNEFTLTVIKMTSILYIRSFKEIYLKIKYVTKGVLCVHVHTLCHELKKKTWGLAVIGK